MDIDRIKKINKLAIDLVQQGLAVDKDDAISQAEKIFKVNNVHSGEADNEVLEDNPQDSDCQAVINTGVDNSSEQSSSSISPDELKLILEKNTSFIVNKIQEFNNSLSSLENKFNLINKELQDLKNNQVNDQKVVVPNTPEPVSENKEDLSSDDSSDHPRSGDYNDEDVSIEKFFYAGTK